MAMISPPRATVSRKSIYVMVILFVVGWVTFSFSLADFGRYSVTLLYLAALPFCFRISSRSVVLLILPLLSTVLAALVAYFDGFPITPILSQGALQLLAIAFGAGVAAIDWRQNFVVLTRVMVIIGVPLVAFGGYQMIARANHLRFAYLPITNQQVYATGGLQRGWWIQNYARASSLFAEPSEFGYYCLWLLVLGVSLEKGALRYSALVLAFSGILFSQSLGAVLGVGMLLLVYFVTHPLNLKVLRQSVALVLLSGVALLVIPPMMPDSFARFSKRIQQALTLDERADSGRVDHLPACWAIIQESPIWGHGLASIASTENHDIDSTTVAYAMLLMERGAIGTALLLAPWIYIAIQSLLLPQGDKARTPIVLLTTLQIFAFCTSSVISFLPYWLSLGMTASLLLRTDVLPSRYEFSRRRRERIEEVFG
jgi:O-antigen ligase